jgi:hypothetical protein
MFKKIIFCQKSEPKVQKTAVQKRFAAFGPRQGDA